MVITKESLLEIKENLELEDNKNKRAFVESLHTKSASVMADIIGKLDKAIDEKRFSIVISRDWIRPPKLWGIFERNMTLVKEPGFQIDLVWKYDEIDVCTVIDNCPLMRRDICNYYKNVYRVSTFISKEGVDEYDNVINESQYKLTLAVVFVPKLSK